MGVVYYNITPISREAINKPDYLASDQLHPRGTMYAKWVEQIVNSSDFEIITTDVSEYSSPDRSELYPNPASRSINIRAPQKGNSILIYNSQGTIIWQSDITSDEKLNIHVSGWSKGVYYYQIRENKKAIISGKFLIERNFEF